MKKLIITVVALALAAPALAGNGKANTGCGLGTMLFGAAKADNSILLQILAVTTNGTSGSQTFGISSGTSECDQPSSFVRNERVNEFVHANLDNLARDVAQGGGETVSTLAELLEVPAAQRAAFGQKLQSQFTLIFPTPDVQSAHVVDAIVFVASQG
jgi:hypothetical protein